MSRSFLATLPITNFIVIKDPHKQSYTHLLILCATSMNITQLNDTHQHVLQQERNCDLKPTLVCSAVDVTVVPFIMACSKRMASSHTTK